MATPGRGSPPTGSLLPQAFVSGCVWAPWERSLCTHSDLLSNSRERNYLPLPLTAEAYDAPVKVKWLAVDYSLTLEFNLECVYWLIS